MLIVRSRWEGELHDVRAFVAPQAYMVRAVAERLRGRPMPRAAWEWVVDNIRYSAEGTLGCHTLGYREGLFGPGYSYTACELWRFPWETIRDRMGDCEDMAGLMVSLVRAVQPGAPVYVSVGWFDRRGHAWVTELRGGRALVWELTAGRDGPAGEPEAPPYRAAFRFNDAQVLAVELEASPIPVLVAG